MLELTHLCVKSGMKKINYELQQKEVLTGFQLYNKYNAHLSLGSLTYELEGLVSVILGCLGL